MSTLAERQNDGYRLLEESPKGRFGEERPALFSPAIAAQEPANNSRLYFHWNPIFIPYEYTNWIEECSAHVQSCYIGDWSPIAKIKVRGPEALEFLTHVGTVNLSKLAIDQAKQHIQVDENGFVASEGIVYRTANEDFIYTGGGTDWTAWQLAQGKWDAQIEQLSAGMFLFEIQGPTSLFTLERLFGTSLRDIGFNRSRVLELDGVPIRILRTGVSGELGYELHGPADQAASVWSSVVEAGSDYGIKQLGLRSQLVAHIEAGIATTGIDYLPSAVVTPGVQKLIPSGSPAGSVVPRSGIQDYFRFPGELAWGARVNLQSHDFIGRDALARQAAEGGPQRQLVGLVWNAEDLAGIQRGLFEAGPLPRPLQYPRDVGLDLDRVVVSGQDIGVSSSRTYSPTLRQMISLGVLDKSIAVGTQVTVIWGAPGTDQREIRATVHAAPLKTDRRRTDVSSLPAYPVPGA